MIDLYLLVFFNCDAFLFPAIIILIYEVIWSFNFSISCTYLKTTFTVWPSNNVPTVINQIFFDYLLMAKSGVTSYLLNPSIPHKSWHLQLKFDILLKLLRLKLRPRKVAAVARVQAKKIQPKIMKSAIFEVRKRYTPQKKSCEQSSFRFEIKLEDFFIKKLKKMDFVIFNKIIIFYRSRLNFWKTCQDSKKMT